MPEQNQQLNSWAIVEVMGHKRFAGFVTEQTVGAFALIRVDVPETTQPPSGWGSSARDARTTPAYSKLIGPGSIYCITPRTEEVARRAATELERYNDPIPVAIPESHRIAAPASVDGFDSEIEDAETDDDNTIDDHCELCGGEYEGECTCEDDSESEAPNPLSPA